MVSEREVVIALELAEQVATAALRGRRPSQRAGLILWPVELRIIAAGITAVALYGVGVLIQKLKTVPAPVTMLLLAVSRVPAAHRDRCMPFAQIATRISGAPTMASASVNLVLLTD